MTDEETACETGRGTRLPRGISKGIREVGAEPVLTHGVSGSTPHDQSEKDEVIYLRKPEKPYPTPQSRGLRDACIEDVPGNPGRAKDAERYGLVPRIASWSGRLFEGKGWRGGWRLWERTHEKP